MILSYSLILFLITLLATGFSQRNRGRVSPCELSDMPCIRYLLARNSDCDPNVWGSIPSEVRFNTVSYEMPSFNTTYADQYMTVKNLNKCYVSAFTFNVDKNRLVLSVTCPNIVTQSRRQLIQHYPLQQDRKYDYQVEFSNPPVIFTVDFPRADKIDLCDSYAYSYLTGLPKIKMQGLDPASSKFQEEYLKSILSTLNLFEIEKFSPSSNAIYRLWVNNILCNFDNYCKD